MIARRTIIIFLLSFFLYTDAQEPIQTDFNIKIEYEKAQTLLNDSPDSAVAHLKYLAEKGKNSHDSLVMMSCMRICKVQGLAQDFADAFHYGLQALRIATINNGFDQHSTEYKRSRSSLSRIWQRRIIRSLC